MINLVLFISACLQACHEKIQNVHFTSHLVYFSGSGRNVYLTFHVRCADDLTIGGSDTLPLSVGWYNSPIVVLPWLYDSSRWKLMISWAWLWSWVSVMNWCYYVFAQHYATQRLWSYDLMALYKYIYYYYYYYFKAHQHKAAGRKTRLDIQNYGCISELNYH